MANKPSDDFSASSNPKGPLITMETPRLVLREHVPSDAQRIYEISNGPGFFYYCLDGSMQKAEEFIDEALRTQHLDSKTGMRENHMLAIVMKDTGEVIGHTCLERVYYRADSPYEVNFFVDPQYQNKGYGIEAIINLMDWAFRNYNLMHMTVTVHPNNGPSRHLIVREGFVKIADIEMKTVKGMEPRELFHLTRDVFYEKRTQDKRPLLLPPATPPAPKPGMP